MSAASAGQRLIDYFVVCGLDSVSGLEPDQLLGKFETPIEGFDLLNSSDTELKPSLRLNALERVYNSLINSHSLCIIVYFFVNKSIVD